MDSNGRPIIVCGPARAGTTAISALLNASAQVLIGREVPLERLPSLATLLAETAEYQAGAWTDKRKVEVVRALWFAASRPTTPKPGARRWGMKTPWAEFDRSLWDPLVRPIYIYALRRGDRVFQSHIKSGYSGMVHRPQRLLDRYKESIRLYESMRAAGLAHMVQVDQAQDSASREKLANDLFTFLDEDIDVGVKAFVERWPMHWSKPTSKPYEDPELPATWSELLAADSEYKELMATYGY